MEDEAPEFWESNFIEKKEMWGFESSRSAVLTKDLFVEKSVKNMLIPGIGYGRNARIFRDNGINVTGIEISKTAIELAGKHYGTGMKDSIQAEFGNARLIEITEIDENYPFFLIKCKKG